MNVLVSSRMRFASFTREWVNGTQLQSSKIDGVHAESKRRKQQWVYTANLFLFPQRLFQMVRLEPHLQARDSVLNSSDWATSRRKDGRSIGAVCVPFNFLDFGQILNKVENATVLHGLLGRFDSGIGEMSILPQVVPKN